MRRPRFLRRHPSAADEAAAKDGKPKRIELPVSEYGKKFTREQNRIVLLFMGSVFGLLQLQGWLQSQFLRWFDYYFALLFSFLVVIVLALVEGFLYYRTKVRNMAKTNLYPTDHVIVYKLKGGKLDFHLARKTVKLLEDHGDGTKTFEYVAAFRKGQPYERFLVRCNPDFGEHIGTPDALEHVFIGWMGVEKPVCTLAVKEIGTGKDGVPIVRILDSAYYRTQDAHALTFDTKAMLESLKAEDHFEAPEWRGKYFMEKMSHNTTESLRKEAVADLEDAKEKAREQADVLEEEAGKRPRFSPTMKYLLVVLFTVLITLGLVAVIPGI